MFTKILINERTKSENVEDTFHEAYVCRKWGHCSNIYFSLISMLLSVIDRRQILYFFMNLHKWASNLKITREIIFPEVTLI